MKSKFESEHKKCTTNPLRSTLSRLSKRPFRRLSRIARRWTKKSRGRLRKRLKV